MEYILSCPYNTTQIAKKELSILGYNPTITSPTTLSFEGDEQAIARVNINSRVGNKLYLVLGKTHSIFNRDDLFSFITTVDWAKYIAHKQPILTRAIVKHSKLSSVPTIQSLTKKAITQKLGDEWRAEDDAIQAIDILVMMEHDCCSILLNTTGESLHERGYREHTGEAPIKENLAASLVLSSGWKFATPFVDPFCGSGTLCIEAAMIAKNIAPGLERGFAFIGFQRYNLKHYDFAKLEAEQKRLTEKQHIIIGYDNDPTMLAIAQDNALRAGVSEYIRFEQKNFMDVFSKQDLIPGDADHKIGIVTNPPYGERMKYANGLYEKLITLFEKDTFINGGFITSDEEIPSLYQKALWKETQYYNGPLEAIFYKIARL